MSPVEIVGFNFLLLIIGSHTTLEIGMILFCNILMIFLTILKPPFKPFSVTTLKLSREVWYSGYSLDLENEAENLDQAVQKVLDDGLRTKDILSSGKKEVSASQMGDAIISKLK